MRNWTPSACVALAWSILVLLLLAAAGLAAPGHPAQATASTAFDTSPLASRPGASRTALAEPGTAQASPASAPGSRTPSAPAEPPAAVTLTAAAAVTAASPASGPATWTVRPGDTLSAIAAALAVPGGWPALYTANRRAVGTDPDVIRPGTVLTLPGPAKPVRYTVTAGDTLSAIAAALAVPGGWPALYTANRRAVGTDPDVIRPGTVLTLPPAVRLVPPAGHRGPPGTGTPGAAVPGSGTAPAAPRADSPGGIPVVAGMPRWLEDVLLAAGLLAATAFAAEPAAAIARRRQGAPAPSVPPRAPAGKRRLVRRAAARARIILADYDRLIVTYCADDHTVYVLTPPGEDPRAVLRAARLVLPEDTYQDLAGHLGVPYAWPRE